MATETISRIEEIYRSITANPEAGNSKLIIRLTSLVVVIATWEIVGQALGSLLFAPISEVAVVYWELANGQMFPILIGTLEEMLIGFLIAVAVGMPTGLLMGRVKPIEDLLDPWISAFYVTATASLLPLFIIFFGIGTTFRISIVFFASVWFVLLNSYHGAKGVEMAYTDVGRSFNTSRYKFYKDIIFPATLPYIAAGLRLSLIRAIKGIILAEMFIITGYGGFIHEVGQTSASTAPVLALIITLMFVGYGSRTVLEKTEDRLFPWAELDRS